MTDTPAGTTEVPPRAGRRGPWFFLPLVGFLVLAAVFYLRLGTGDASRIPSVLIGKPVPEFSLPAIEGAGGPGLDTAALASGVTVVNVWASWCAPCRGEHPLLMRLSDDPRFRLVGINHKDVPENARRFLGSLGDPFDAIGADRSGRVSIDWGVYGVPETFIVKDGVIAHKFIGPLSEAGLAANFLPALERALSGPPATSR